LASAMLQLAGQVQGPQDMLRKIEATLADATKGSAKPGVDTGDDLRELCNAYDKAFKQKTAAQKKRDKNKATVQRFEKEL